MTNVFIEFSVVRTVERPVVAVERTDVEPLISFAALPHIAAPDCARMDAAQRMGLSAAELTASPVEASFSVKSSCVFKNFSDESIVAVEE